VDAAGREERRLRPGRSSTWLKPTENIMAVSLIEKDDGKLLEVHVSGKLADEDYQHFVPQFERLVARHGKIRVLFEMSQFHGWEARALWDDIKFDIKHFKDIERLAMVGEKKWQKGMAAFCKPFTTAAIRYFDHDQADAARAWLGAN
jgi:hypothetical protein